MTNDPSCQDLNKKLEILERHLNIRFDSLETLQKERQKHFDERLMAIQKASEALITNYEIRHSAAIMQIEKNTDRLTKIETALATRQEGLGMTGVLIMGGFTATASIVSILTLLVHIYK